MSPTCGVRTYPTHPRHRPGFSCQVSWALKLMLWLCSSPGSSVFRRTFLSFTTWATNVHLTQASTSWRFWLLDAKPHCGDEIRCPHQLPRKPRNKQVVSYWGKLRSIEGQWKDHFPITSPLMACPKTWFHFAQLPYPSVDTSWSIICVSETGNNDQPSNPQTSVSL